MRMCQYGVCSLLLAYVIRGIVKEYSVIILGYFFLFLYKNICCGYSLETPHRGTSNEYPHCDNIYFYGELEKIIP